MELFGSTYTGLALKDSDINMNLKLSNHTINSSVSNIYVYVATCNCFVCQNLFLLIDILLHNDDCIGGTAHYNEWVVLLTVMEIVMYSYTVADNGGDDMVYADLKNNLYGSQVSHITFTHLPRFELVLCGQSVFQVQGFISFTMHSYSLIINTSSTH